MLTSGLCRHMHGKKYLHTCTYHIYRHMFLIKRSNALLFKPSGVSIPLQLRILTKAGILVVPIVKILPTATCLLTAGPVPFCATWGTYPPTNNETQPPAHPEQCSEGSHLVFLNASWRHSNHPPCRCLSLSSCWRSQGGVGSELFFYQLFSSQQKESFSLQ